LIAFGFALNFLFFAQVFVFPAALTGFPIMAITNFGNFGNPR